MNSETGYGFSKAMKERDSGMAEREKLVLKKYGNRRLYDTARSTYVTLNQIAEFIRQGFEVEVIDANTKEDVTAYILTQIIMEQAKKKNTLLPAWLLHVIIRYGENVLQEFFEKYLQQIISNYLQFKKIADEQFSRWIDMQLDYSKMAQKAISDFASFPSFFGKPPKPPEKKDKK
jgi:polyhydroxyalkanoate synthesis repressor PhaR